MSTSVFETTHTSRGNSLAASGPSTTSAQAARLAPYVDLQFTPFQPSSRNPNPVPDLISDELYQVLRTHDLINEKGIRDYLIRRVFRELKERMELGTHEAIERIHHQYYPYLQIDTIRKIVYRVGAPSNRKMMI